MRLDHGMVEEDVTELRDIVSPIQCNASESDKARELADLSASNFARLVSAVLLLDKQLGISTTPDCKAQENIEEKASRPTIRAEMTWFRVEHVRDALRFRSVIPDVATFEAALEYLVESVGLPVVKLDLDKMTSPKTWGWRFVGADFRFPGAGQQLVEYYATFRALMDANDGCCHELYEAGRNLRADADAAPDLEDLINQSNEVYGRAWGDTLAQLGMSEEDFESAWTRFRERLGRDA